MRRGEPPPPPPRRARPKWRCHMRRRSEASLPGAAYASPPRRVFSRWAPGASPRGSPAPWFLHSSSCLLVPSVSSYSSLSLCPYLPVIHPSVIISLSESSRVFTPSPAHLSLHHKRKSFFFQVKGPRALREKVMVPGAVNTVRHTAAGSCAGPGAHHRIKAFFKPQLGRVEHGG